MNRYRVVWMRRMLDREMRMVDMQVMASLQNGTAFFASTSLFAIGGALTVLRTTDEMLNVVATLPVGISTTRVLWEMKAIGLAVIFVYAFFKFAWSYRLFNYVSILLGAMPPESEKDTPEAETHVQRTTAVRRRDGTSITASAHSSSRSAISAGSSAPMCSWARPQPSCS